MNFLIYYGIGLAFVTGAVLLALLFDLDDDEMDWTISKNMILTLLLALVWPAIIVTYICVLIYYIIEKIRG